MDYEGQKLCENLFYWIIIIFGAIGWVYGYMEQDFVHVFYAWGVGMILSIIICVPDWPWFNKHPIKWLDSVPDRRAVGHHGVGAVGGSGSGSASGGTIGKKAN
jgi:signal peptidase complex subunit 1